VEITVFQADQCPLLHKQYYQCLYAQRKTLIRTNAAHLANSFSRGEGRGRGGEGMGIAACEFIPTFNTCNAASHLPVQVYSQIYKQPLFNKQHKPLKISWQHKKILMEKVLLISTGLSY